MQAVRDYQARVFDVPRGLDVAARTSSPRLQMGEYLWWFFTTICPTERRMGFYHPEIKAAAQTALGRPLYLFKKPTDDPLVNASADAIFLRNRLRDHVAARSSRKSRPTIRTHNSSCCSPTT